ncbi:MAG: hypothetical protein MK198_04810 [Gracilimonas sp.]|uniref:hypothetical protein n=1 Tax=Gracilimonas sp. TaxID=1974203 RepID=UPI0037520CD7|nr:hypothetical protein [Gracilimonas sp.]
MKSWQSKINRLIFLLLVVAAGCNERSYSDYYDKPLSEWESYLSAISDHQQIELKNTVLLVLKSSECSPALAELSWWNSFTKDQKRIEVKLIIIEKYATTAKVLLEQENIFIPSYRDFAAVILDKDLLPSTPMKVYFDQQGEIENIKPIGAHSNEMEFIN